MTEQDVIEVEVERLDAAPSRRRAAARRVWHLVGPVVLAMVLDGGDLATFGPLGLLAMPAGMIAGYLFSGFLEVSPTWRVLITIATGLYWAAPLNLVPVATIAAATVQLVRPGALSREPF